MKLSKADQAVTEWQTAIGALIGAGESRDVLTHARGCYGRRIQDLPLNLIQRASRALLSLRFPMRKIVVAATVFFALAALPASAQNNRTFVSPIGDDASASCSLAAPCRTFAAAYALTNGGGEIAVLGTAGYGTLMINKDISIVNAGGFEAGIVVPPNGVGILITAGSGDTVSLRGLTIEGQNAANSGIVFNSGKSLTIENCFIRHMVQDGIYYTPSIASALAVSNTLVADNGNDGILLAPSGAATAVFNRVEVNNNFSSGISFSTSGSGTINSTVSDSIAAGNGIGFDLESQSPSSLLLFHSVSANNGTGVQTGGPGATIRLANSAVSGNGSGWVGVVLSDGNNTIEGNGANQAAPTTYARK
jgi:Right handed beta helix region